MTSSSRYRAFLTLLTITAAALLIGALWVAPIPAIHGIGWVLLVVYALMVIISQGYPVRIGSQSINIGMGIELLMFLQFGPILTLVVLLAAWYISKAVAGKQIKVTSSLANFGMYTIMLLGAAIAYHGFGGTLPVHWHSSLTYLILPVFAFMIVHLLLNYFISFAYMLAQGNLEQWMQGIYWDLSALGIEVGTAWIFLFLFHMYGPFSAFYIALPFAATLYIFRLYFNLYLSNQQLTVINKITTQFSAMTDEQAVVSTIVGGVFELVNTTTCYFFSWNADMQLLYPLAVKAAYPDVEAKMWDIKVKPSEGITGLAFSKRTAYLQRKRHQFAIEADRDDVPTRGAAILAVPLIYQDEELGVLTLTHEENNAYTKKDQEMMQILATNVSIVLWNLRRFAKTEERNYLDDLTGLYNYRYFEKMIPELCHTCDRERMGLVLLVLDIDHFKQVNDTYGHLVGNEVLKGIARLLKEMVREMDVVCRYGGEEFTVILPGTTLEMGQQIAERLRMAIEKSTIALPPVGQVIPMPIRVTVSVGVASYPDMGDSPMELLRHADRAMYVGSKQQGRNRVAVYEG